MLAEAEVIAPCEVEDLLALDLRHDAVTTLLNAEERAFNAEH